MKKGILLLLLLSSLFTEAQSIKEALFKGKLKNEGTVRKGDDLTAKIDTTTRKVTLDSTGKVIAAPLTGDSSANKLAGLTDSAALAAASAGDTTAATSDEISASESAAPTDGAAITKNNNAVWKQYVDSVSNTIKTEVLSSKKIKKGTYYATVSYAIDVDGKVTINDVFLTPENPFLHSQIKDRLELEAPQLSPVLSSSGAPRKVSRKYNFTLTKE